MTLTLDDRQRAMLAEMGIRLFAALPRQPAAVQPEMAPPRALIEARARTAPATAPATPDLAATPAVPRAASVLPQADSERAAAIKALDWPDLEQAVAGCEACGLCRGRRNTVFGVGDRQADWMIIGEAPGENEDLRGEPFVGNAGQLLDNMLRAVGLDRSHRVYIANVIKCRPPGNRNPDPAEVAQCEPFLRRQIALVQPKLILAMGRFAVQSLLATQEPIGKLRGRLHAYQGVPVVVTYHPAYLLRNLPDKAKAWADLCLALDQAPPRD